MRSLASFNSSFRINHWACRVAAITMITGATILWPFSQICAATHLKTGCMGTRSCSDAPNFKWVAMTDSKGTRIVVPVKAVRVTCPHTEMQNAQNCVTLHIFFQLNPCRAKAIRNYKHMCSIISRNQKCHEKKVRSRTDSFTVPFFALHSPNCLPLGQCKRTVTGVWKTVGIPTGHVSP